MVNAVDDHLAKGEQIDVSWSREAIKVLPALLQAARMARRLVVFVSDHGHVLDTGTTERKSDGGERWRLIVGEPQPDELCVRGSRVLVDGQQLIAPWTEQVRYASKKNGDHGGLSPQEMVIPIVVLASSDDVPDGWSEQPVATPGWWDETTPASLRSQSATRVVKPAKTKPKGKLFEIEANGEVTPAIVATVVSATPPQQPEWISRRCVWHHRIESRAVTHSIFARWFADRARKLGFATAEVQVFETETPLHRLETVYRRLMERLSTADTTQGAWRNIVDGWFYTLEEDVLAEGTIDPSDDAKLLARTSELLEQRLAKVSESAPMFSAALRVYREALSAGDQAVAEGILAWLAGQPNVAVAAKRAAGVKGDIDHYGALNFPGLHQNLWVKRVGKWIFEGMTPMSNG